MARNPLRGLNYLAVGIDLVPITPDDDENLATTARAVRCRPDGNAGALRITTTAGNVRNTYIAAGEMLIVSVTRVHDTGTDATNLEAVI